MRQLKRTGLILKAPAFTGALLFLCLSLAGCDRKAATPDWSADATHAVDPVAETEAAVPATAPVAPAEGLRFMAYNLENWLTMERRISDRMQLADKPDEQKAAAVRMIVAGKPDVLGVCEIGTQEDVDDLRKRLRDAGWEMPHVAFDPTDGSFRRLALLSRLPIVGRDKPEVSEYQMLGRWRAMSRPILDATVERGGSRYRFVGVHLKSKREVREGDQEEIRRQEAKLLRRHLDAVLKDDPTVRWVAYGDFNDTLRSVAMKTVVGYYRAPTYMTAIPCADSKGHRWTHHWQYEDVYSRFDYVLVSPALKAEVDFRQSRILDDPDWELASDHRPLLTIFKAAADR